jgi:hypothetical protein
LFPVVTRNPTSNAFHIEHGKRELKAINFHIACGYGLIRIIYMPNCL